MNHLESLISLFIASFLFLFIPILITWFSLVVVNTVSDYIRTQYCSIIGKHRTDLFCKESVITGLKPSIPYKNSVYAKEWLSPTHFSNTTHNVELWKCGMRWWNRVNKWRIDKKGLFLTLGNRIVNSKCFLYWIRLLGYTTLLLNNPHGFHSNKQSFDIGYRY